MTGIDQQERQQERPKTQPIVSTGTVRINLDNVRSRRDRGSRSLTLRFLRRPSTIVFGLVLAIVTIACFVGPFFALSPSSAQYPKLQPPSAEHLMGTDHLGRDLFARVLQGGQVSLLVGVSVAILCLTLAIVIGGMAGYYGGFADTLLMKVSEFFQVVPGIILALVAAALLGTNMIVIILILSMTMWPQVARIVRAETLRVSELGYVESARAVGFGSLRVFVSDVLPNVMPPVLVATTMTVGRAILLESGLAFLGLGDANVPSWGALLNAAQPYMQTAWWLTVFPGLAIFVVVLSTNILGDTLNDILNPTIGRVKQ
ncbi:ABC transporter permease [Agromyces aerolatus]|uniref:ABC transporter permease n=1 Tax=Agromyces sp. LY-1074 TaxID=3074080 RepID=UPI0028678AE9|nr:MULTISPECIES: ABC transporter permease [unclassified Agromyces]MDR5699465.1 ABC transporter permease [Agromyces sp. LY-1074]MDR5705761.1 ABC transporter permease [Agromyces sp. LY-1358]